MSVPLLGLHRRRSSHNGSAVAVLGRVSNKQPQAGRHRVTALCRTPRVLHASVQRCSRLHELHGRAATPRAASTRRTRPAPAARQRPYTARLRRSRHKHPATESARQAAHVLLDTVVSLDEDHDRLDALIGRAVPGVRKAVKWELAVLWRGWAGLVSELSYLHEVRESDVLPRHVAASRASAVSRRARMFDTSTSTRTISLTRHI